MTDLQPGHQLLARRDPKPADGYNLITPAITLATGVSVTLDQTHLPAGGKRYVRANPKPADGWAKDPMLTLAATDSPTIRVPTTTTEPPPPTTGKRGWGKDVTGSSKSQEIVTSLADLKAALQAGGNNIKASVPVGTIWSLGGATLAVKDDTTYDNGNLILADGGLKASGPVQNIWLKNLRAMVGDKMGNAGDLDGLTLNGVNGPVRGVYVEHSQLMWAPDVSLACLNDVAYVTLDNVIFAEQLNDSAHGEFPHSLGPNIDCLAGNVSKRGYRISLIDCASILNFSRNLRSIGGAEIEANGFLVYGHGEGPQGCPQSLSMDGVTLIKAPQLPIKQTQVFRGQHGDHCNLDPVANSVFVGAHQVIGYTDSGVDASLKATTRRFTPSMTPETDAAAAMARILANAGAYPADKHLTRVRNHVTNKTGIYVNGVGKPNSYTALI